jgi:hypothetical protein
MSDALYALESIIKTIQKPWLRITQVDHGQGATRATVGRTADPGPSRFQSACQAWEAEGSRGGSLVDDINSQLAPRVMLGGWLAE